MEFLLPNVYHLSNIKSFKDGLIKSQYPDIDSEEKFVWKWSDDNLLFKSSCWFDTIWKN